MTIVDNLITGRRENLERALELGAVLHEADIRDVARLEELTRAAEPDLVFHLAAQADVRHAVAHPEEDAAVNVLGTISVLQAARSAGVSRVVNTSTGGGMYGDARVLPTPEHDPIHPMAPYGQSKLAAEGYCELYTRLHALSTISLRYGNVYGPRQDVHGEAGVVAIFCGCLIEGRQPTVYGDGRQTRDWVDVEDVVRANLAAADSEVTGPVNIGWGREISVLELLNELRELTPGGAQLEPVFAPERLGEVRRSCLDVSRARQELGWEARVELREGLRRVLAWLGAL